MAEDTRSITRGLSRLNTAWLGLSVGTLFALGLFTATIVLVLQGGNPSEHLALLGQYFPGYTVSFGGSFIGGFWAFLFGLVLTTPAGLFYYRRTLNRAAAQTYNNSDHLEESLGETIARIDLVDFPVAAGLTCGVAILTATAMLLITHTAGEPLAPHLALLGEILPGFSVSWGGSLVGFAYLSVIGGLVAACVGWVYNRIAIARSGR